jgi:RNA polymerase sigma-70 factor (ECF subfamily)
MDEAWLIDAAKQGDLEAFNRLVLAYQNHAFNLAYRIMGDPDQAADITQTGFLSAFRNIKGFRGGSFRAWILRIMTNACYDELRRQKRRPSIPLEPLSYKGEEVESPSWLEDPSERPEEAVARSELSQAIQQCIQRLPPEFRAVVVMIDVQGLDYAEAAEAIGRPLGTVKSRLARARLRVQKCLQGFKELLPSAFRLEEES